MTKDYWLVIIFILDLSFVQTFCVTEWDQDHVIMEKTK